MTTTTKAPKLELVDIDALVPHPEKCCVVLGCGKPSEKRRRCDTHYAQLRRSPEWETWIRPTLTERLWAKIERDASSGCWLWTGALDRHGYGAVNHEKRAQRAHRVVYEVLVGPIDAGHDLDHLCRVPRCVCPMHLEPVTRKVNLNRGAGHGGALWTPPTHCVKGHALTPDNLRRASGKKWPWQCAICRREVERRRDARRRAGR